MGKVNSIPTNPKTSVYTTVSLIEATKYKNGGSIKKKSFVL